MGMDAVFRCNRDMYRVYTVVTVQSCFLLRIQEAKPINRSILLKKNDSVCIIDSLNIYIYFKNFESKAIFVMNGI